MCQSCKKESPSQNEGFHSDVSSHQLTCRVVTAWHSSLRHCIESADAIHCQRQLAIFHWPLLFKDMELLHSNKWKVQIMSCKTPLAQLNMPFFVFSKAFFSLVRSPSYGGYFEPILSWCWYHCIVSLFSSSVQLFDGLQRLLWFVSERTSSVFSLNLASQHGI